MASKDLPHSSGFEVLEGIPRAWPRTHSLAKRSKDTPSPIPGQVAPTAGEMTFQVKPDLALKWRREEGWMLRGHHRARISPLQEYAGERTMREAPRAAHGVGVRGPQGEEKGWLQNWERRC